MMELMTAIDDLLAHNDSYVPKHGHNELPTEPQLHLAVLTRMSSRLLQPYEVARSSLEQKFVALSSTLTTETCEKSQSRNRLP